MYVKVLLNRLKAVCVCFLKVRFADDDSQVMRALLKACFLNKSDRLYWGVRSSKYKTEQAQLSSGALFSLAVCTHPPSLSVSG